jgi:hypothetical protein
MRLSRRTIMTIAAGWLSAVFSLYGAAAARAESAQPWSATLAQQDPGTPADRSVPATRPLRLAGPEAGGDARTASHQFKLRYRSKHPREHMPHPPKANPAASSPQH